MKKTVSFFITLLLSTQSLAIDCPATEVVLVQVEKGGMVLVYPKDQNWHRVGHVTEASTQYMFSALLAAQMSGKKVILRYPDGYDCNAYELQTGAIMVGTHNE